MKITQKGGIFKVKGSAPGAYYDVDLRKGTCTCPHYRIRLARIGAMCKHLIAVQEKHASKLVTKKDKEQILGKVRKETSYDIIWLMEEFSEEAVNALLDSGELIEDKGQVRIMD